MKKSDYIEPLQFSGNHIALVKQRLIEKGVRSEWQTCERWHQRPGFESCCIRCCNSDQRIACRLDFDGNGKVKR